MRDRDREGDRGRKNEQKRETEKNIAIEEQSPEALPFPGRVIQWQNPNGIFLNWTSMFRCRCSYGRGNEYGAPELVLLVNSSNLRAVCT